MSKEEFKLIHSFDKEYPNIDNQLNKFRILFFKIKIHNLKFNIQCLNLNIKQKILF